MNMSKPIKTVLVTTTLAIAGCSVENGAAPTTLFTEAGKQIQSDSFGVTTANNICLLYTSPSPRDA